MHFSQDIRQDIRFSIASDEDVHRGLKMRAYMNNYHNDRLGTISTKETLLRVSPFFFPVLRFALSLSRHSYKFERFARAPFETFGSS
jgi:hypothetical protein